jgi:hypothetical protein
VQIVHYEVGFRIVEQVILINLIKMKIYLLIITFTSIYTLIQQGIDYIDLNNKHLAVNLTIGYPGQFFQLLLDTYSDYTWVKSTECQNCGYEGNSFNRIKSETLRATNTSISMNYMTGSLTGELVYDYILLKTLTVKHQGFIVADRGNFGTTAFDGVLGVYRLYDKNELSQGLSFLHKLKDTKQIEDRVFSIQWNGDSAKIYFGKLERIPGVHGVAYAEDSETFSSMCNCDNRYKSWNCMLSHILLGEEYNFYRAKQIGAIVEFATGVEYIYIPISYKAYLWEEYINKNDPKRDCCKAYIEDNYTYVRCFRRYVERVKDFSLNFILNGYAYKLDWVSLFEEQEDDTYMFKIIFYESSTKDTWIFGNMFLKQYHTIFNGDDGYLEFHGGFRYDFSSFTRDKSEAFCLYNYLIYVLITAPVIASMAYVWFKKRYEERVMMPKYKINYKKF